MDDRFKFRIPMFTDKEHFMEFQYLDLGDEIECTLCGSNGKPQQCTGLKDQLSKLIYEGDIISHAKYNDKKYIVKRKFDKNYNEYVFCDVENTYCEWYFNQINTFTVLDDKLINAKVVGNVYENTELLVEDENHGR